MSGTLPLDLRPPAKPADDRPAWEARPWEYMHATWSVESLRLCGTMLGNALIMRPGEAIPAEDPWPNCPECRRLQEASCRAA